MLILRRRKRFAFCQRYGLFSLLLTGPTERDGFWVRLSQSICPTLMLLSFAFVSVCSVCSPGTDQKLSMPLLVTQRLVLNMRSFNKSAMTEHFDGVEMLTAPAFSELMDVTTDFVRTENYLDSSQIGASSSGPDYFPEDKSSHTRIVEDVSWNSSLLNLAPNSSQSTSPV